VTGWFRERSHPHRSRCRVSKGARRNIPRIGARAVPRGSVTRQKLSFASREVAPRKGRGCGSARIGSPIRTKNERSEKVLRARARPREPFTRLGGVGLGFRVIRPEIATRSRADAGGHSSAGGARRRRSIRGTPTRSAVEEDNTSARSVGSPKRALRRESATPRIVWEHDDAACAETKRRSSLKTTSVSCRHRSRGPGSPPGRSHAARKSQTTLWAPRQGR